MKDDEALLKKTVSKKLKVKAKRTEKWNKRAQVVTRAPHAFARVRARERAIARAQERERERERERQRERERP